MLLAIVHKSACVSDNKADSLLRLAFSGGLITDLLANKISECCGFGIDAKFAVPAQWKQPADVSNNVLFYDGIIPVQGACSSADKSWFVISDARYFARIDQRLLYETINKSGSDIVAVDVESRLKAGCEKILTDSNQNLVGIRLLYADAVRPVPVPSDWPHYLFIRSDIVGRLFKDGTLPENFTEFLSRCRSVTQSITSMGIGGITQDLNTEEGLLSVLSGGLNGKANWCGNSRVKGEILHSNNIDISKNARLFGEIAFGRGVSVGADAIVAGPAVIAENARIGDKAVIRECIIGPDVFVPDGCVFQNRVITSLSVKYGQDSKYEGRRNVPYVDFSLSRFRTWPRLSYARAIKRIADIIVASIVLIIFAPVLPFIALAVKLSSKGPVFFKDMRQGLHGKSFACLKFRTMLVGADTMQEKLRSLNEADGPQFVISDDPRMSRVGRFLRETYLDEIPQFLSILLGHMSLVGPRPSPESENVLCPFWRDARLSVRPGLTGLWQVCRTRQPMKDFQEWINYDIEYVRNLSLRLDLWLCWKTAQKMFLNFVRQF
jgi:lipopolysaccharide/colanic/teichoic acid biosynthesis glycosyltransferase